MAVEAGHRRVVIRPGRVVKRATSHAERDRIVVANTMDLVDRLRGAVLGQPPVVGRVAGQTAPE
jgi:hypothetical protein